jgi:hypothetical protein
MNARLDFLGNPMAMKLVKHINSAGAVLTDSTLPVATQELVKLRARTRRAEHPHRRRRRRRHR